MTADNSALLFALVGKTGKARDRIIQAMLLRQLIALGQSIARMHTAIGDVRRAEHINRVLTEQLTPLADRLDPRENRVRGPERPAGGADHRTAGRGAGVPATIGFGDPAEAPRPGNRRRVHGRHRASGNQNLNKPAEPNPLEGTQLIMSDNDGVDDALRSATQTIAALLARNAQQIAMEREHQARQQQIDLDRANNRLAAEHAIDGCGVRSSPSRGPARTRHGCRSASRRP